MTYTPLAVANEFIARHGMKPGGLDHMKLQKLTYYAHGWWLAYEPESLLVEKPEVWKFGPVFGSLYRVLAPFGSRSIAQPQRANPFQEPPRVIDERALGLVDWVWDRYGSHSSMRLSDMTHEEGTPWRVLAEQNGYNVPKNFPIPDDLIAAFFKKEAEKLQAA